MPSVIALPIARNLRCSDCGAPGEATCDCGAAYVPAGQLAAKAIAANPDKSDRAIAEEIGVSHQVVGRARKKATGPNGPVATRTGRDGKARKPPVLKIVETKPTAETMKKINKLISEPGIFTQKYIGKLADWLNTDQPLPNEAAQNLARALSAAAAEFGRMETAVAKRIK